MPAHSIVETADCPAAEQLLLTIGRAGVLSSRAIAAEDLRRCCAFSVRRPNVSGATSSGQPTSCSLRMALSSTGHARANSSTSTPRPMRWRACKRLSHEHRRPQARAGLAPQLARRSQTLSSRHARRCRRLGRAHRRADARSLTTPELAARGGSLRPVELTRRRAEVRSLSISEDLTGQSGLGSHGPLKSARLRRKSEATSSTLRPCKSTAALRAAIVSLLSWPDSFSKGALICGNRSKVVLRTTGASM